MGNVKQGHTKKKKKMNVSKSRNLEKNFRKF